MENTVVFANFCFTGNHAMVADAATISNLNCAINNGVRAHTDSRAEYGARINDGCRVNTHATHVIYGLVMVRWVHSKVASQAS